MEEFMLNEKRLQDDTLKMKSELSKLKLKLVEAEKRNVALKEELDEYKNNAKKSDEKLKKIKDGRKDLMCFYNYFN